MTTHDRHTCHPIVIEGTNLPPAYRLVALDSVDRTNDEAKRVYLGERFQL